MDWVAGALTVSAEPTMAVTANGVARRGASPTTSSNPEGTVSKVSVTRCGLTVRAVRELPFVSVTRSANSRYEFASWSGATMDPDSTPVTVPSGCE